jgi:hypothetical protein
MTITKHAALLLMSLVELTGFLPAPTRTIAKAQVPFAFVANGKAMPAGECTIALDVNGRTLLSISSGEQHAFAIPVADESSNARKKTVLVFHRYGERHFLTGVHREKNWLSPYGQQTRTRIAGPEHPVAGIHASRIRQVDEQLGRSCS